MPKRKKFVEGGLEEPLVFLWHAGEFASISPAS
jgi:hypothetical protein